LLTTPPFLYPLQLFTFGAGVLCSVYSGNGLARFPNYFHFF
jgi:hypothetical protein